MSMERRYTATEFELRESETEGRTLSGYAAVFNSPAVIGGRFREQVAPRAFNKSLKEADVRALFNHDPNIVLGRSSAKTLHLKPDEHGLRYEIDLPDTQQARDLWTSIQRGDISQSSFAFEAIKQEFAEAEEPGGMPTRTLKEVFLHDVSPVTYPAYEDTEVQARNAEEVISAYEDQQRESTTPEQSDEQPQALADTQPEQEPQRKPHVNLLRGV